MKSNKWLILLTGLFCLMVSACNDEENITPIGKFEKGVLVVNEGKFGQPEGSITFYHILGDSVTNDVVKNQNNGSEIGATLISAYSSSQLVYLVSNEPDKIEVVGRDDFKFASTAISGSNISQPRFMTAIGNKGYVSCWGPWEPDYTLPNSFVAVIDLTNNTVLKRINVDDGAEGIIAVGNKIFVAGSYSNFVTVINSETDEVVDNIETTFAPTDFVVDADQKLWVICKGSWGASGALARINTATNENELELEIQGDSPSGKIAISGDKTTIYYLTAAAYPSTGTKVYGFLISSATLPENELISGNNFYGIGVNPEDDIIYVSDSQGFISMGKVLRYQKNGAKLNEFGAGIGPAGFLFY